MSEIKRISFLESQNFMGKKMVLFDLHIKAYRKHRLLKKSNLFSSIEQDINNINHICQTYFEH